MICNVTLGNNYFKSISGLDEYEIYIDPETTNGFEMKLQLKRLVPVYRPGTEFGEVNGKYFTWFCAVPSAKLTGTVTIGDDTTKVDGSEYHDHNWRCKNP